MLVLAYQIMGRCRSRKANSKTVHMNAEKHIGTNTTGGPENNVRRPKGEGGDYPPEDQWHRKRPISEPMSAHTL